MPNGITWKQIGVVIGGIILMLSIGAAIEARIDKRVGLTEKYLGQDIGEIKDNMRDINEKIDKLITCCNP